jgi:N-methylhydantoinase A/oxoprolinase/acetone carboxylase beta subunit
MVSLATTFATNAIVEDRGAEAGIILVGYDDVPQEIPKTTRVLMVKGGHTVSGEEKEPLELDAFAEQLDRFIENLDAVAVTGFFSIRNPQHEIQVAEIIRNNHHLPVVRGHRLSARLNAIKRATTAWWNARLIPLISNLIKATEKVLSDHKIAAPLMIVRGDGTLMSAPTAMDRPVDTLLSGPAASILGTKHLSGLDNALIVDMGGTTTDMASLAGGRVAIDPLGATVGKWKTHVEAAKVRTVGLGGDSLIALNSDRSLVVGPRRVIPLCVFAQQHPEVTALLEKILKILDRIPFGRIHPCSFYFLNRSSNASTETDLTDFQDSGLISEYLQFTATDDWFAADRLKRLERRGLLFRSSLTPTDLRVASGQFDLGVRSASQLGLSVFAAHMNIEEVELLDAVEESISKKLCMETISFLEEDKENAFSDLIPHWFYSKAPDSSDRVGLDLRVSLTAPVIGAGAPAATCLPIAFKPLRSECVLPEAFDVSVAVGAVVGMVDRVFRAVIRPGEDGRFILHSEQSRKVFDSIKEAIDHGRKILKSLANDSMRKDYVKEPLFDFNVDEKTAQSKTGEHVYLETLLNLRATGRPDVQQLSRQDP